MTYSYSIYVIYLHIIHYKLVKLTSGAQAKQSGYIHLNEFLIAHFLKYDIMRHIQSMHILFGYFVVYTPIHRLMERIKLVLYTKLCENR